MASINHFGIFERSRQAWDPTVVKMRAFGSSSGFLASLMDQCIFFGQRRRAMNLHQFPLWGGDRVPDLRIRRDAAQF
jgi:hypothetical protein